MNSQLDLFGSKAAVNPAGLAEIKVSRRAKGKPSARGGDEQTLVRQLEDTGRYRILKKLQPRPIVKNSADPRFPHLGVIIDTETTGLNHAVDEVIEIGAVAFRYSDDGQIGDVVGVFSALQQPSKAIPEEITKLTGITDDMVRGHAIHFRDLEALIEPASLIIAHNARFDRPFCERLSPVFVDKAWACSNAEVDWVSHGFEGTKLGYLIGQCGYFHDGHRAADDCHALLEVLARPFESSTGSGFSELLTASRKSVVRLWAQNSPFEMKDHLKARGYRWSDGTDGNPKAWWTEVSEDDYGQELQYLREEIYGWPEAEPLSKNLTAVDRYR